MACDRTRYKRLVLGRAKYKRNRLGRGVAGWGSSKSWDIRVKFWGKLGYKQKYMYFDGKPSKKGWKDSACKSMPKHHTIFRLRRALTSFLLCESHVHPIHSLAISLYFPCMKTNRNTLVFFNTVEFWILCFKLPIMLFDGWWKNIFAYLFRNNKTTLTMPVATDIGLTYSYKEPHKLFDTYAGTSSTPKWIPTVCNPKYGFWGSVKIQKFPKFRIIL